jgi:hypothetical protein
MKAHKTRRHPPQTKQMPSCFAQGSVTKLVVPFDLYDLVVKTEDQKGRRPLAYEQALFLMARQLEDQGYADRSEGQPEEKVRRQLGGLFFNRPRYGAFLMLRAINSVVHSNALLTKFAALTTGAQLVISTRSSLCKDASKSDAIGLATCYDCARELFQQHLNLPQGNDGQGHGKISCR